MQIQLQYINCPQVIDIELVTNEPSSSQKIQELQLAAHLG